MTAAFVAALIATVLLVGAGTAAAPGLSEDQLLANSEAQGWGAR